MPRKFLHDAHEQGLGPAWMGFVQRRHLRAAAYLLLAAAVIVAIASSRHQNSQQTKRLETATSTVLTATCNANNDLRKALRSILEQEPAQIAAQVKAGHLTPAEAATANQNVAHDIGLLGAKNCAQSVSIVTHSK